LKGIEKGSRELMILLTGKKEKGTKSYNTPLTGEREIGLKGI
jgi:hypothetical protein